MSLQQRTELRDLNAN